MKRSNECTLCVFINYRHVTNLIEKENSEFPRNTFWFFWSKQPACSPIFSHTSMHPVPRWYFIPSYSIAGDEIIDQIRRMSENLKKGVSQRLAPCSLPCCETSADCHAFSHPRNQWLYAEPHGERWDDFLSLRSGIIYCTTDIDIYRISYIHHGGLAYQWPVFEGAQANCQNSDGHCDRVVYITPLVGSSRIA